MALGINRIFENLSIPLITLQLKRLKQTLKFRAKNLRISCGCKINHSRFEMNNFLGPNVIFVNSVLGSFSYVGKYSKIINTKIGRFCSIGTNVQVVLGRHPTNFVSTHPAFYSNRKAFKTFSTTDDVEEYGTVEIGNDVWIAEGVIIPDSVKIGNGAIIAARSVVTKDVEPYTIVGGNPAKFIRYRFDQLTCKRLESSKWWEWDEKKLKLNHKFFQDPDRFFKID